jgi:hypothetical protein
MGCLASLPAVSELAQELESMSSLQWQVIFLDIHVPPANAMLERFGFSSTPTYLVFDGAGAEVWRSNRVPSAEELVQVVRG